MLLVPSTCDSPGAWRPVPVPQPPPARGDLAPTHLPCAGGAPPANGGPTHSVASGTPAQPQGSAEMRPPAPGISPCAGPPAFASSHPTSALPSSPERALGFVPALVCVTSPACLIHGEEGALQRGPLSCPPALWHPSAPQWVLLGTPLLPAPHPDPGWAAGLERSTAAAGG